MIQDAHYLFARRSVELALQSGKQVKTNPLVGAVIVHKGKIIGEGRHETYGQAHAEVNAVHSVPEDKKHLLPESTIYVSLEPCNFTGKTPPCVNLLIKEKFASVYVVHVDPNPKMQGKSFAILEKSGVPVHQITLNDTRTLEFFSLYQKEQRSYVYLKFAQSAAGYLSTKDSQVWLSNAYSKLFVHQWRSKIDGILVGRKTVEVDNPQLTTREYPGDNPTRIALDPSQKLNLGFSIFNQKAKTLWVVQKNGADRSIPTPENVTIIYHDFKAIMQLGNLLEELYKHGIYRLMVEGGARTLQSFVDENLWDSCLLFKTPHPLDTGIKAPIIQGVIVDQLTLGSDDFYHIHNKEVNSTS